MKKPFYQRWTICAYRALVDLILHDGVEHAGYLAFLMMLGLFPFLVFFVSLAGVVGESGAGQGFITLLFEQMPEGISAAIKPRVEEIVSGPPQELMTLAIIGAVWTASSAVEGLRTILNRAYGIRTLPSYILRRVLSIMEFFLLSGIIVFTMLGVVMAPVIYKYIKTHWGLDVSLSPIYNYLHYFIVILILFIIASILYFMIPNVEQTWRTVAPGALVSAIGWLLAGMALTTYVEYFEQFNFLYGSLAGIIAALIFFYIIAMIFIYGAEYNNHLFMMLEEELPEGHPLLGELHEIHKEELARLQKKRDEQS